MGKTNKKWLKNLYIFLGTTTLILGVIGIFLPLLPTTPFLLLTAYFYSKSSEKLYNKLLENKVFGKYIKDFREGNGITIKTKIASILSIWVAIFISTYYFIPLLGVKILLVVIALLVSIYLLSLKTLKE